MTEKELIYSHWKVGIGSIEYYSDGTYKLKNKNNNEIDLDSWTDEEKSGFITAASILVLSKSKYCED